MSSDHVSELLGPYLRGELSRDRAHAVDAHLTACRDCAREAEGLRALLDDAEPPTDVERARLHRAVERAVRLERGEARGWRERIAPFLGAAALVVLVGGGIAFVASGGGGTGQGDAGGAAQEAPAPAARSRPERGNTTKARTEAESRSEQETTADRTTSAAATAGRVGPPRPRFDAQARELDRRDLARLGRRNELFQAFATSYTVDDVERLGKRYVERIARAAPRPPGAAAVRDCAATVTEAEPRALATYAAYARLDGTPSLILGFVAPRNGARLDRYMFWVWPRADCDRLGDYLSGRVRRQ